MKGKDIEVGKEYALDNGKYSRPSRVKILAEAGTRFDSWPTYSFIEKPGGPRFKKPDAFQKKAVGGSILVQELNPKTGKLARDKWERRRAAKEELVQCSKIKMLWADKAKELVAEEKAEKIKESQDARKVAQNKNQLRKIQSVLEPLGLQLEKYEYEIEYQPHDTSVKITLEKLAKIVGRIA